MKTMEIKTFDSNILRCYARKDNSELYNSKKLDVKYDVQNFETFKFELPKISKLKNDKKNTVMENKMKKFINDDNKKVFCIISPYGTGKTFFIKNTIEQYSEKFQRCLILTHRRTLANDIEK